MQMDLGRTYASSREAAEQGTHQAHRRLLSQEGADTDLRCHSHPHPQTPFPMQNADLPGNRRASSLLPRDDPLLSNTEQQCSRGGGTFLPCEHFGSLHNNNRTVFQSSSSAGLREHLRTPADTQTNRALFIGDNSHRQGSRTACMSCHTRNSSGNQGMASGYEQQSSHASFDKMNRLNVISTESGQRQRSYVNGFPADHHEQRYQTNNLSDNQENSIHFDSNSNVCCQYPARNGEPLYRSLLRPHQCREPPCLGYAEGSHLLHHEQYLLDAEASAVGNCSSPGHQFANFGPPCVLSPALDQVTLYNWYLIRPSGSCGSEIAVGGFLSNRALDCERVETATIVKRLEEYKLLTKDGNVVNLVGSIDDFRTISNGFPLQTVQLFISGFPHIWNLVVGMGLSNTKGMNTCSQSCDLYGGEVTSQINLEREAVKQGTCLYQPARANILTSCRDNSKVNHGLEFVTRESQAAEMASASVVQEHQGATVPATGIQSNVEPLVLHEKTSNCRTDAEACIEAERDDVKETEQDVFSNSLKGPHNQVLKLTVSVCGHENMHREDVEAPISVCRSEDNALEPGQVEPKKDDNEQNQAQVETVASAAIHIENVQREDVGPVTDFVNIDATCNEISEKNVELSFAPSAVLAASMRAEDTRPPLSQRRKVTFTGADEIEVEDPSYMMAKVTNPTQGTETASFVQASGVEKDMIEKEEVKRKGKRKKEGRYFLPKLKRSSKSMKKRQKRTHVEVAAANTPPKDVSMQEVEDGGVMDAKDVSQVMDGDDDIGAEIITPNNLRTGEEAADTGNGVFYASNGLQVGHPSSMANLVADADVVVKKENIKRKGKRRMQGRLRIPKSKRQRRPESKPSVNAVKAAVKQGKSSSVDGQVKMEFEERKRSKVQSRSSGHVYHSVCMSQDSRQVECDHKSIEDKIIKTNETSTPESKRQKSKEVDLDYDSEKLHQKKPKINAESESDLSAVASTKKRGKMLLPPLPLPIVSVSKQLVSKAFGLKTSRAGRLLVPPLAHWRNQSVVRDKDGGIVGIEGVSDDTAKEDTGLFNFRPPMEARAKNLQKWLSVTASECFKAHQQQRPRPKQK